jgi:hypothetical protein
MSEDASVAAPAPEGKAPKRPKEKFNPTFFLDPSYYEVKRNGLSPFQNLCAYLGGSAIQTVGDNPVTAYRQLVQQYAKGADGNVVAPKTASLEARRVFINNPVAASLSGLVPRLVGVLLKRIPKFGFLLGYTTLSGNTDGEPGYAAATAASILSAPFINPVRMVEKQQRTSLKKTGKEKPIMEIMRESRAKNFQPLFRGTVPLMGHSLASATTGLVGQPQLQKYIQRELGAHSKLGASSTNLVASCIVSPIYVVITNPLSRLEVIQQTSAISGKPIGVLAAVREIVLDSNTYGLRGMFRGQGIGIGKAVVSLSLFHEGRVFCQELLRSRNRKLGRLPAEAAKTK